MDYKKSIRVIEYEHQLLLYDNDLCDILNVHQEVEVFWHIEDMPANMESEIDGFTRVICANAQTGDVLWDRTFLEKWNSLVDEEDNSFYQKILKYVKEKYEFGDLLVDIYTPKSPMETENGERLKLVWTTLEPPE